MIIRHDPSARVHRRLISLGDLRLEVLDFDAPHRLQLTPGTAEGPDDSTELVVLLNQCTPELRDHDRRHDTFEPERLLLLSSAGPSVITGLSGCRSIALSVPLTRLGGGESAISGLTALPVEETILTRTLSGLIRAVVEGDSALANPGYLLARSVVDLVRTVLIEATQHESPRFHSPTLRQRALDYIDTHYTEPELNPARVASGLGVSLRYAHREFTDGDSTLAAAILYRRLADVDSRLQLDPLGRVASLSELARLTGFSSLTTLSRAFRREYGCSMSEYRARVRETNAASSPLPR